jgi:hypothetical protein
MQSSPVRYIAEVIHAILACQVAELIHAILACQVAEVIHELLSPVR